ncbi:MAG: TonB-dependent receptor plug domain-containing protein [Chlorobi bacterium]|nr:TonB-dependent receptor plug domain-containing protein [Chlorobiota bacterium]MCI0717278.1 TonB-dependent receptor plug domain-containing protein [Chlorobiota bacterium]
MSKSKICIVFIFLVALNCEFFSQDTLKTKTDTTRKPQTFILSENKYKYLNQTNPDTVTRKRFLWYPLKNLDDLFNYLPGYYLKYMDVGQINQLNFNQLSPSYTAVLRHGRPINDEIDGSIDLNLLSRNEIDEVELTNGFGNFLYNYSNGINIIQRQIFQNRPYTEISFYQDRTENLYLDANYHQNIFKNFNFNFGITKHSYDGFYTNSDFDKWLGRFNLNFAASSKLNFFAYINYAKIQRGLNEGLNPDTVNLGSKDAVFNPDAAVRNSDSYEKKERFDVDAGSVFLIGKSSFTKLQLFVSNSFREYRDEENRPNSNGIFVQDNNHWINYGVKLKQVFNFKLAKHIYVISRSEGEYNYRIIDISKNYNLLFPYQGKLSKYNFLENINAEYKKINLSGFIRWYTEREFKGVYYNYGIKGGYSFNLDTLKKITFTGQYNQLSDYWAVNINYYSNELNFKSEYFKYTIHYGQKVSEKKFEGVNNLLNLRLWKLDLTALYTYNFSRNEDSDIISEHSGNLDVAFHDIAFKNKLEYKIGLNSRFWTKYRGERFNGRFNWFTSGYVDTSYNFVFYNFYIPSNATLDFYIIGKIGRATFGLTFENILDRIVYNTGVYPYVDRGGFLNFISRFNITWNFFD